MYKYFKKVFLFFAVFFTAFAISNKTILRTSASDSFKPTDQEGAKLVYNHDQGTEDFGYVSVHKTVGEYRTVVFKKYVIVAFDVAEDVETITGTGFEVKYKTTNFFNNVGNAFLELFGGNRKYGTLHTDTIWVEADTEYSFGLRVTNTFDEYEFNAIGLMSDLKAVQNKYHNEYNPLASSVVDKHYSFSLSYKLNGENHMLETSSRTFASRSHYAVIPYNWTEEVDPESIDYYDVHGTFISSGTNKGKPFEAEESTKQNPLYYLDVTPSKHFMFSINGKNAVLKKIEITNFPVSSSLKLLIENATWDYENQKTDYVYKKAQFISNEVRNVNWAVDNDSRLMMIKYSGESSDLEGVAIRVYYTNSNEKASWIMNVYGEKGLNPPGVDTTTPTEETMFEKLMRFLRYLFAAIVIILVIKLLVLIFQFIGSARTAFGKRR